MSSAFTHVHGSSQVSWCELVDTGTNRAGAGVQPSPSPGAAPGTVEVCHLQNNSRDQAHGGERTQLGVHAA